MSASTPVLSLPSNVSVTAAKLLPHSSVVLGLAEIAEKYALLVPFRLKVVNGFMAADNVKDPSFVVDEIYSVHLVREMKAVRFKIADHGAESYTIPLNSLAKFGLIHDERNECMMFDTVEELLYAKPRPKVVAVKNKYVSQDGKVSLKKNEVLIIRDLIRAKIGRSKVALKFYSLIQQKEVVLHKEHDVQFTTNPYRTQLYLTDLVECSTNLMPCLARIFSIGNSSIAGLLSSTTIMLQGCETCQSLIISLFRDNPTSDRKMDSEFIAVPTNININVSIIETSKDDDAYYQIMEESRKLMQDYNPADICACLDAQTDDVYTTQAQLLSEVRKEKEKENLLKYAPRYYQNIFISEMKNGTSKGTSDDQGALCVSTSPKRPVSI